VTLDRRDGGMARADVLVTATGFLHHPHIPDFPGVDRFRGATFHSARWDHDAPLDGRRVNAPLRIPAICMEASAPVSKRCFARFHALRGRLGGILSETDAFVEGVERYVRGDLPGAAKLWRPLLREPGLAAKTLSAVMEATFERTGDSELVERLEVAAMDSGTNEYNGAALVDVRAARRAAKRGDATRARELANKVIRAWSVADQPVPAVAEMRKLLTELH